MPTAQPWNAADFEGDDQDRCKAMVQHAINIDQAPENSFAADHDLDLMRMFEQRPLTTLYAYAGKYFSSNSLSISTTNAGNISPMNILRAVVSTAHAMLARSKVRGRFLTSKGSGRQKKRAEQATSWLDGWSSEEHVHELSGQALLDAEVCRFGVLQIYEKDGKAKLQRCLPQEIVFDHVAAHYGRPRVLYRKRAMSKSTLLARKGLSKAAKDAIEGAKCLTDAEGAESDMVLVWEGYAIRSSATSKDGWHGIGIDEPNGLIEMKPWDKDWDPFIFFIWDPVMVGFGGVSLAMQLENMQSDLNFMLYVERKAMKLFAVPRILVKRGSRIIKTQLSNQIAAVIEWSGDVPPAPAVWNYLPEQFFREKDKLIDKMYSLPGISQNASEGTKPEGTESGAAQREAMETQNLRVQIYAQRSWEAPHVEIYEKAIEMAADIVSAPNGSYKVLSQTPGSVEEIDFKGIVSDLKIRKITCYPTGFLPLTPAARLDFIKSMLDAKLWDVDRAKLALADLDVEAEQSLENSIQGMFNKVFEGCLYDGKPSRPDELAIGYFDLAIKTGAVYMALAKMEDLEEKNIDLAQRYLDELRDLKTQSEKRLSASAAPPTAPAAQAGAPAAVVPGQAPLGSAPALGQ